MSELDELVALKGVLMAGRFGPDWQVAEHKYTSLFYAEAIGVMGSFCSTIQMMFNTMGVALEGFTASTWLPVHGWMVSGGDYSIYVHGDRLVMVQTEHVASLTSCAVCLGSERPRIRMDGWRLTTPVLRSLRATKLSRSWRLTAEPFGPANASNRPASGAIRRRV